ncbi:MAG TPA: ROK family protein [Pyrinomonadaceae bacterium]|nr:ROK family protein [Pyrinomonadaceae bacterium]
MAQPAQPTTNFIGVDVSGQTLRVALVGAEGAVLERREAPLEPNALVAQIARTVTGLRDVSPEIAAIGIGIPGLVNRQTDRVLVSTDLPTVVRGDFHAEMKRAAGMRVELENDANAAAYGEYQAGAGRGSRDMFYATIGAGIGGAIILNGKLWLGASGFAGEFGHITIDAEGIECICGNAGCLETVASGPNIVRRANERLYRDNTSSLSRLAINKEFTATDVVHEAQNGDDFSLMMLERTGKYIGAAVASVINLLNIERIVLGGSVMEAGPLILDSVIHEAERRAFQPCFEATQIVAAALGTDAVAVGAALLARDATPEAR